MPTHKEIRETIFSALDELNNLLPAQERFPKREDTPLAGPDGRLDSLGLVNLIVILEQKLEAHLNASLSLIDDRLADGDQAHFDSVRTLATYIASRLDELPNG
jgi:acyl carrier protein